MFMADIPNLVDGGLNIANNAGVSESDEESIHEINEDFMVGISETNRLYAH